MADKQHFSGVGSVSLARWHVLTGTKDIVFLKQDDNANVHG